MPDDGACMSVDQPTTPLSALATGLEVAVNAWLRQDPETAARFAELEGRAIELRMTGLGWPLYFLPGRDGIRVRARYQAEADTRLSVTPLGLLRLATEAGEEALFGGEISIEGDTELGQQFQDLLAAVEVDWEERLSRFTGDLIAHQIGDTARDVRRLLQRGAATLRQDLSEYLQEELRLLPAPIELRNFLDEVDRLRMDVDRVEARIRRCRERAESDA